MIKLPPEIEHMIKTIEAAGFEAYAVGGCTRDSILGRHPEDWDLTTNATGEILKTLFPEAVIVNRKLGVMRVAVGGITADLAAYRIDGIYTDYRRPDTVSFTNELEEDLKRRDFTMNAIAVSPSKGMADPFNGEQDIIDKLIRGIGEPRKRFEEDALRILRGIRFAAQLGFEIETDTFTAMKEKAGLLSYISRERLLDEFTKTISAQYCGTGLRLFLTAGVLPYLLGSVISTIPETQLTKLERLAAGLNALNCDWKIKAALIYLCLDRERAKEAIPVLGYSNEMKKMLLLAVEYWDELVQIGSSSELKRFICRMGRKEYLFLEEILLQRCKVYGLNTGESLARRALFETAEKNGEPIFLADLAVSGEDLKNAGIAQGKQIGKLLNNLLELVHEMPERNQRAELLKAAGSKKLC